MISSCYDMSQHIQELLVAFLKRDMWSLMVSKKKESIICERMGWKTPSLWITVFHHSASLMMPNGDPLDGLFYSIPTLMIDSYILACQIAISLAFIHTDKSNFATWEIFHAFLWSDFFLNQLLRKILSGIPSECQTDWIQIRPDILSA